MPGQIRKLPSRYCANRWRSISLFQSFGGETSPDWLYEVENFGKIALTEAILETNKRLERVLILPAPRRTCRELTASLNKRGMDVGAIHSDLTQDGGSAVARFKKRNHRNTDVLSRGNDIKASTRSSILTCRDTEDYNHRIGAYQPRRCRRHVHLHQPERPPVGSSVSKT